MDFLSNFITSHHLREGGTCLLLHAVRLDLCAIYQLSHGVVGVDKLVKGGASLFGLKTMPLYLRL